MKEQSFTFGFVYTSFKLFKFIHFIYKYNKLLLQNSGPVSRLFWC